MRTHLSRATQLLARNTMFSLYDLLQDFRVQSADKKSSAAMSRSAAANHVALKGQAQIDRLQEQVDYLSIVCVSLAELLEETGISSYELKRKIEEVDLRDGVKDGKLRQSNLCGGCGRKIAVRRATCIYCGHYHEKSYQL